MQAPPQSLKPLIVGIGGTTRAGSATEKALRYALRVAENFGARTEVVAGPDLAMPLYEPHNPERTPAASRLIDLLRRCQGVIIATPSYHGSVSGLIKNALDYTEDMRSDEFPYLHSKPVGCIVCAGGPQAIGATLAGLRFIIHALRGWPTPLGVAVLASGKPAFDDDGGCTDASVTEQMAAMNTQIIKFAQMRMLARASERWKDIWPVTPTGHY